MRSPIEEDELVRERAIDPHRCILLQAPAGSGKTTVLTARLLRLLAEVEEPEQILAMTFTRKAAAEMRARVLRALRGELPGHAAHEIRQQELAERALRHSRERGWNLEQDPGRLRIQTLDAFNFRLASQLPVTARAGAGLNVTEAAAELYLNAARRTLEEAESDAPLAADVELLFARLDNNWRSVESMLAEMLERRSHWLRYVLGQSGQALLERVNQTLEHIVCDQLCSAHQVLEAHLRDAGAAIPVLGSLGTAAADLAAWKDLAALALTAKGEWRKPTGITRRLGAAYEERATRAALAALIGRLSAVPGAHARLVAVQALPAAELGRADAAALEALARVLRAGAGQLQAEFALAGRVDHTYIAGAARQALTEAGLPSELALRTGLALRHVLVDEFQDTSLAQFELLTALTAGWSPGDGRTLFLVGDPMQSIYQFREAEVGLFLRARERGLGDVRLEPLALRCNFRSHPNLIRWINTTFEALFPHRDDLRASAVSYSPSSAGTAAAAGSAAIELRLFAAGDRAGEARALAERIGALRAIDPTASIAVLVVSRAHAAPVSRALELRGIETVGVDLLPLREMPIVRDLVALTCALHHLGDRSAWLAVLRAPWCGVTLTTLSVLSRRSDPLLLAEALVDPERLAACPAAEAERLSRVGRILSAALEARAALPLADFLESTWVRLGGPDAYPASQLPHARAFFEILGARAAAGEWVSPRDFEPLLADLYARQSAVSPHPVQIMTVHRAKGLEFDHVFVPALDRELNHAREPLLRWLDLARPDGASDLIMAPVPPIGVERPGEVATYLRALSAERAAHEQLRLLYVAATRSRRTLHWSGTPATRSGEIAPRRGTALARLWPALGSAFEAPQSLPDASGAPVRPKLRRLVDRWEPPTLAGPPDSVALPTRPQELEPVEFSWVGETFRHIGSVVHAAFEALAQSPHLPTRAELADMRLHYRAQLLRLGVPEAELERAAQLVGEAVRNALEDERGRWILSSAHAEHSSELALTGLVGGQITSVRVDRSFVDAHGARWVIDYKTSRHEGAGVEAFLDQEMQRYEAQLRTYRTLARGLGPQPVRAALYFPLLRAFRELS